ncbi:elongation of very long chain fatty acids protein AAEL008004-like isoform X1 [Trichoplusia ni]|uniref:Elongation of very long chain fatty acids protein n=2 Tax=Trichoplusia ni TaxID=7111 RepID=A0A7E5VUS4_TRINI|nr:elongation of very long chain fatty acids protein AAEL008004-like isoform X1 [Trichoplusia ni]XP_026732089.1 elongation of very long chain fatty acids protein AAEL008004-like isoform X1 [Trichoplusia ni]XP_026745184.1 elongation of very long chain fatty acids protein AAEL008004-like isoform X1 [Trichoplusia ni]
MVAVKMGTLIGNITNFYHYLNDDLADPRTKDFLFVSSPVPLLVIMFVYHRFVQSWGPAFMANRQPYNVKNLIIVYNIIQIALSIFLTTQCLTRLYLSGYYSPWCQKINYEDTPLERDVVSRVWLYYMIKLLDLLDTIFFVLRKKFNQVSFLHVYHHLGMCALGFFGTKYVPGGHGIMLGFINSIVHAVMYSYYLISIVRPQWVRQWWKKYITQLQILQFLLLILHFGHVLFEPSCEYPKWVSFVFLPHNIFILFLFCDFYIKEYILKKNKNKSK